MMYKSPIGVGIIGIGRISDLHIVEYIRNPDTQILMLCDINVDAARKKASSWGLSNVEITDDLDTLLNNPAVDLVEVLLPHSFHFDTAMAAMNAGKAVSLQKPMCTTEEHALRLVNAVENYDRPFKIFENFIFYPPVLKAQDLVQQGAIGEPLSIRIKSNPGISKTEWHVPKSSMNWRQQKAHSGGGPLIFDDGHHKFAIAWAFMGYPDEVHAFIGNVERSDGFSFDAQSIVSFRFPGNRIGNLEVVYSPELEIITRHYAQDDRVEITGTKGVIWINCGHGRIGNPPPVALYANGVSTEFRNIESGWESSFENSTRHYIDILLNGGRPILTAREGLEILQFASAAERSARDGCAIQM